MNTLEQQNKKEKFKNIVWDSGLSDKDKDMWYRLVNTMDPITLIPLLESLEMFPEDLPFLTKNFKEKVEAFRTQDETEAQRIIEEERIFLEKQ